MSSRLKAMSSASQNIIMFSIVIFCPLKVGQTTHIGEAKWCILKTAMQLKVGIKYYIGCWISLKEWGPYHQTFRKIYNWDKINFHKY